MSDHRTYSCSSGGLSCVGCGRGGLSTVTYIDGRPLCSICVGKMFPVVTAPIPFGTVTLDDSEVEALAQDRDRWMRRAQQLEAERHTCPGCNDLATLLVNADACPLRQPGEVYCVSGGYPHICADEDTADCVARIVAWEEGR